MYLLTIVCCSNLISFALARLSCKTANCTDGILQWVQVHVNWLGCVLAWTLFSVVLSSCPLSVIPCANDSSYFKCRYGSLSLSCGLCFSQSIFVIFLAGGCLTSSSWVSSPIRAMTTAYLAVLYAFHLMIFSLLPSSVSSGGCLERKGRRSASFFRCSYTTSHSISCTAITQLSFFGGIFGFFIVQNEGRSHLFAIKLSTYRHYSKIVRFFVPPWPIWVPMRPFRFDCTYSRSAIVQLLTITGFALRQLSSKAGLQTRICRWGLGLPGSKKCHVRLTRDTVLYVPERLFFFSPPLQFDFSSGYLI